MSDPSSSRTPLLRLACLAACLLPAAFLAQKMLAYAIDIPYWDEWVVASLVAKSFDGTLSFGDLTSQQNESRLFFPRLFFLGLARLTGFDVRFEMWGSFGLAVLVAANVHRLGRITLADRHGVLLFFLASSLIFGLAQWQNWFWGIQFIVFVPIACLTTIVTLAYADLPAATKFVTAAALSTVSTFSYANGMVCWIVALPLLLAKTRSETRPRWMAFWLLACVSNVALYFHGYVKPAHHPSLTGALARPLDASVYFLRFLGSPLASGAGIDPLRHAAALCLGSTVVVVYAFACGCVWKRRAEPAVTDRTAGWLTLGAYSLISAGVTTLGRLGLGSETALASRYTTFAYPLIVASIYLVPIVFDLDPAWRKMSWRKSGAVGAATLVLLHVLATFDARRAADDEWRDRRRAKAALHFIETLPPHRSLARSMFPDLGWLSQWALDLDRLELLSPPLRKNLRIDGIERMQGAGQCGWLDGLEPSGGVLRAHGWAADLRRRAVLDGIVLARENADRSFTIFEFVESRVPRPDVARAFGRPDYLLAGWQHSFVPPASTNPVTIAAWGVDADTGRLCRLGSAFVVSIRGKEARVAESR